MSIVKCLAYLCRDLPTLIMRILFDYKYNYLGSLASINNRTINPLFVCTRANYGSGLRAAATYHANDGVSVK